MSKTTTHHGCTIEAPGRGRPCWKVTTESGHVVGDWFSSEEEAKLAAEATQ